MADCINFPKKPMDFIKYHSWEDKERIYTNGGELVTVFRVEQMLDHYMPNHAKDKQTNADRIRAMSDEQLADFIEMKQFFAVANNGTDGEEYTLEYLRKEVEEQP